MKISRREAAEMGFAGSSRIDDRRRRRIALEPGSVSKKNLRFDPAHGEQSLPEVTVEAGSPLLTWLPHMSWLLVAGTALVMALVVGAIWAGLSLEGHRVWGPVVGAKSGSVMPMLAAFSAIVSAQICYVIYWFRKRSRRDFAGRYRRWLTASFSCVAAAVGISTGLHHLLGTLLCDKIPPYLWNTPAVCWTVPVGVLLAFLGPSLMREVRFAGPALFLLLLTLLSTAACLALHIVGDVALAVDVRTVLSRVLTLVASSSLMLGLWWHARHVCRFSNEPPPKGQFRSELRRLLPKRTRKPAGEAVEAEDVSASARNVEAAKPTRRRPKAKANDEVVDEIDAAREPRQGRLRAMLVAIVAKATAPGRAIGERWSAWRAKRAEAAELKRLERQERKELKAKAASEKQAAREAAVAERAAAKEKAAADKADAKRAAAEAKIAAREAKRVDKSAQKPPVEQKSDKAKAKPVGRPVADEEEDDAEDSDSRAMSAADRRAERKARKKKQKQRRGSDSEDLMPEELR